MNNEMNQAVKKFKETMENIREKVKVLGAHIGKVKDEAKGKLDSYIEELNKKLKNGFSLMKDRMNDGFEKLRGRIETDTKKLKALMSDLSKKVFGDEIGKLKEGISKMGTNLEKISDELKRAVEGYIENAIKDLNKRKKELNDLKKKIIEKTS